MQNNALITRPADQSGWDFDGADRVDSGREEENRKNQRSFHMRPGGKGPEDTGSKKL